MINIYEKYGYYKEGLVSITMKGIEGAEKIKAMLEDFRNNPLKEISGYKVESMRDYSTGKIFNYIDGKEYNTNLPISNVIYYDLEDSAWCCVRPSGTEPKIKFYVGVKGISMKDAELKLQKLKEEINNLVNK